MISYRLIQGDSYEILRNLASQADQKKYRLIITSPPYYNHRHYGSDSKEIGQEQTSEIFIKRLADTFVICRDLLAEDGSLWIVMGDTRRRNGKLMIPHRLALRLVDKGYRLREDIIWYKKNSIACSSRDSFSQAYEIILYLSKNEKSFTNMQDLRIKGNEVREGTNKTPPPGLIQYGAINPDREKILKIKGIIHNAKPDTPIEELPATTEIAQAYGYDPEKYCPTCYRKFKRHATRKRVGDHRHYPIFAVCNSYGKNPGNVWEVSTKAHYGNEHFAIFPEDLIARIITFATEKGDWVLDPFAGRGTTGIVCALLGRNFTGIDLYSKNLSVANKNILSAIKGEPSPQETQASIQR